MQYTVKYPRNALLHSEDLFFRFDNSTDCDNIRTEFNFLLQQRRHEELVE